jgi:hypothetical protein
VKRETYAIVIQKQRQPLSSGVFRADSRVFWEIFGGKEDLLAILADAANTGAFDIRFHVPVCAGA